MSLLVLNGDHPVLGEVCQYFTKNETETAIDIAEKWNLRGWKPVLFSKTATGTFKFLFDYRKKKRITKKKAA